MNKFGSRQRTKQRTGWKPRGLPGWSLTALAFLIALVVAVTAWYMLYAGNFLGPGLLGAMAYHFPLHLLIVAAVAVMLLVLARAIGQRLAALVFAVVIALTVVMALLPALSMWLYAREHQVQLSIKEYIGNGYYDGVPRTERTVVYGKAADSTELLLDVWLPPDAGDKPVPAVILVHGGGWISGSRGMLYKWNEWLNGLGYAVFDLDYRMPPPVRWRTEVGDVKAALGWVVQNAADYKIDTSRLVLWGNSAGANLAMLAANTVGNPELPPSTNVPDVRVKAVVNIYGPQDLPLLYHSSGSPAFVRDCLQKYIGGAPEQYPDRYRLVSPINYITPLSPPVISILGKSDRVVPLDQIQRFDSALDRAGVARQTYLLPAGDHGFDANWGGLGTQFTKAKIRAFLDQHIDKSAP